MEELNNGRQLPNSLDQILGDVCKVWKKTNPDALRALYAWNNKADNFLFKNRSDQLEYLQKNKNLFSIPDKATYIDKQIEQLKSSGMLMVKEADTLVNDQLTPKEPSNFKFKT